MPVTSVSKGQKFLDFLGIVPTLTGDLKAKGIKLTFNVKSFGFLSKEGEFLASGILPVSVDELLAADTSFAVIKVARDAVTETGKLALKVLLSKIALKKGLLVPKAISPVVDLGAENNPPVVSDMPEAVKVKPESVFKPVPSSDIILLRDAKTMYQRVRGTSGSSVYVVVAFNDEIKVAARIHSGHHIAMRVEPSSGLMLSAEVVAKLKAQGIDHKGDYASGHFECSKVPVARVLGAVLIGLGIPFATPLPDASVVAVNSK